MSDERLVKQVALEARKKSDQIGWMRELKKCLQEFEWDLTSIDPVLVMSNNEIKMMLKDCAWRKVKEHWEEELEGRPKLKTMKTIYEMGGGGKTGKVKDKALRRILTKLRGGTAELRIETGRWSGLKREDRIFKECNLLEVEDAEHFLLRCGLLNEEREALKGKLLDAGEWEDQFCEDERAALILDKACQEEDIGRQVKKMWKKRMY